MDDLERKTFLYKSREYISKYFDLSRLKDDELYVKLEKLVSEQLGEVYVPIQERVNLTDELYSSIRGLGLLDMIIKDDDITEVMINGTDEIFIEKSGKIQRLNQSFDSQRKLEDIIQRIVGRAGREVNQSNPIVDTRLPDGSRVSVVLPPVALKGPTLTIRKFSKIPMTVEQLIKYKSITPQIAKVLETLVKAKYNIFISGGTGSGKTTFLNALSNYIPNTERVITIEDSAELQIVGIDNLVKLETRNSNSSGKGSITIRDLIKTSLRMRPERIIVGEVRGAEALDMLQAMNTGHDGSLTTLHAGTAQEAILRLVLMARFGMDLPAEIIEKQIATALDLIVMSQRFPDGKRYVTSVSEISLSSSGSIEVQEVVSFDAQKRSWLFVKIPSFINRAIKDGLLNKKEVTSWMSLLPQSQEVFLE